MNTQPTPDNNLLQPLAENRRRADQAPGLSEAELARIFAAAAQMPSETIPMPTLRRRIPLWPRVAAAVLLLLLGGGIAALLLPDGPAPQSAPLAQAPALPSAPTQAPTAQPAASSPLVAKALIPTTPAHRTPPQPVAHEPQHASAHESDFTAADAPGTAAASALDSLRTPPPSFSIEHLRYDRFVCSAKECDTLLFFYQAHLDLNLA